MKLKVDIKRAYDPPSKADGYRVLVDRLWPRGLARDAARIDEWAKDLAPSTALRRWFNHEASLWKAFVARYRAELEAPEAKLALERLQKLARQRRVTLVYAAKDSEHSNAAVLQAFLTSAPRKRK
jgi:uncharacterized protein YeaO (DUF488 family)